MIRRAPGLALAGAGVAISLGAHRAVPALPPLVLCVGLGILVANVSHVPAAAAPGLRTAAGPVLKLGVVLLGLDLVDKGTTYGLTGAVFARDLDAIEKTRDRLRYAAGNFYVNDKPTGAVVGQQPFGGARASGTNDKAGSMWNLIRWVSPRTIKETLVPPTDYRYPFLAPDGAGDGSR